jgi:hypothetical protein
VSRADRPELSERARIVRPSGVADDSEDDDCDDCRGEQLRTKIRMYSVSPNAGGGWPAWRGSFRRFAVAHLGRPSHCLVITQDPNQRYVQLIVGHGGARVEVSSNFYLRGIYRLDRSDEALLARLGFRPRQELDPDEDRPKNWWLERHSAGPEWLAVLVTEAVSRVVAFDPRQPVTVEQFGKDRPCRICTWGDPDWSPERRSETSQDFGDCE